MDVTVAVGVTRMEDMSMSGTEAILLPSAFMTMTISRLFHHVCASSIITGLVLSKYIWLNLGSTIS